MFRIKNWDSFQSYKDRNPPWIRLHKKLIDDFNFQRMSAESRALLPMLWLLAAEDSDPVSGMLRIGYEEISFRLRADQKVIKAAIDEIVRGGFIERIHDENTPLFNDKTDSYGTVTEPLRFHHSETETETETDNIDNGDSKKSANKVSLADLSVNHISEWLMEKRVGGKYLSVDEFRLLEIFKDYCTSKGKVYKDYVAAYRNAFEWASVPRKGNDSGNNRYSCPPGSKTDRARAAIKRGLDSFPDPDESGS